MPSPARNSEEGVEARKVALRMLDAVLRRGQTMDNAAQAARGLPPADAALASAIAGETLRRLPDLDELIDGATRQPLPDDSKSRMVLRLALAQKIGLSTPDHAVVATALPLVDGGPRRLVHGVLGTLLRKGLPAIDAPRLPEEVERRWRDAWGDDVVTAARRAIAHRPPLDLSFANGEACASYSDGISLAPRHRRLDGGGAVTELPGFGQGQWWIQDLAASLPARLIPSEAVAVLDACAAPGGKTMQLAAAGHRVAALDRSESRLARLSDNLKRTGLHAETVAADALEWIPETLYDAVLLDAPCSATGTFRRHPEVLYRARPEIIEQSAELQERLLSRTADWVRPGGSLVYAVCSLEPQEGEFRIEQFLAQRPDYRLEPATTDVAGVAPHARGWVRVLPGMLEAEGGLDGFFTAHLVRSAA
ncbi:RsmB/NOP family class I SAM-dependent RNA methyltransferase [Sphingomonas sp. NSE70-1]|uniref:RsmB/NOP family class I SAM-dependent RNA methyltransferase n=1 Tax=Sphingomonas caseinilyticus TaxID=2908205 RepID=A0ABT0RV71_9SPHN|nr:RsmB/NOP family class I SAM-dependent RNA methyltransferase [Sphingomonas caseinilyticus]MCL6698846.1 RsmB/NOP family class I SAM-dependent RNA methyltransferase [Sphingomonas caseinilyticus]